MIYTLETFETTHYQTTVWFYATSKEKALELTRQIYDFVQNTDLESEVDRLEGLLQSLHNANEADHEERKLLLESDDRIKAAKLKRAIKERKQQIRSLQIKFEKLNSYYLAYIQDYTFEMLCNQIREYQTDEIVMNSFVDGD